LFVRFADSPVQQAAGHWTITSTPLWTLWPSRTTLVTSSINLGEAVSFMVACGDNRFVVDAPSRDAQPEMPFTEMPMLPDYNHASETAVAAAGNTVVVLAIHQRFLSADSFEPPETDDDANRPFRRLGFVRSTDGGDTYSQASPLVLDGRTPGVLSVTSSGRHAGTAQRITQGIVRA
jgi:hypothetical protein